MTDTLYCTAADVRQLPDIRSADPVDDAFIDSLIEGVSRAIDLYCGGRSFFANSETRYFDLPADRQLDFEAVDYLLTLAGLANGDGTIISASDYILIPRDGPPYYALRLKETASISWQPDSDGNTEQVIGVAGTWGMVDRDLTDARSMRYIIGTREACRLAVHSLYTKRYGQGAEGLAQITAVGVVVTPKDLPPEAKRILDALVPVY